MDYTLISLTVILGLCSIYGSAHPRPNKIRFPTDEHSQVPQFTKLLGKENLQEFVEDPNYQQSSIQDEVVYHQMLPFPKFHQVTAKPSNQHKRIPERHRFSPQKFNSNQFGKPFPEATKLNPVLKNHDNFHKHMILHGSPKPVNVYLDELKDNQFKNRPQIVLNQFPREESNRPQIVLNQFPREESFPHKNRFPDGMIDHRPQKHQLIYQHNVKEVLHHNPLKQQLNYHQNSEVIHHRPQKFNNLGEGAIQRPQNEEIIHHRPQKFNHLVEGVIHRPQNEEIIHHRPQKFNHLGEEVIHRPQNEEVIHHRPQKFNHPGEEVIQRPQKHQMNHPNIDFEHRPSKPQMNNFPINDGFDNRPQNILPEAIFVHRPQHNFPQGEASFDHRPQHIPQNTEGVFDHRPQHNFPQGVEGSFDQRPQHNFPQGGEGNFDQRPQHNFPQGGESNFDQRPQHNFPQGDEGSFDQRPQHNFPQESEGNFDQRPQHNIPSNVGVFDHSQLPHFQPDLVHRPQMYHFQQPELFEHRPDKHGPNLFPQSGENLDYEQSSNTYSQDQFLEQPMQQVFVQKSGHKHNQRPEKIKHVSELEEHSHPPVHDNQDIQESHNENKKQNFLIHRRPAEYHEHKQIEKEEPYLEITKEKLTQYIPHHFGNSHDNKNSHFDHKTSGTEWIPINAPEGALPAKSYDIPAPDLSQGHRHEFNQNTHENIPHRSVESFKQRLSNVVYGGRKKIDNEEVVSASVMVKQ